MESEEIGFEIVRPLESHAQLIMAWRNNPETLQMSFHTKPKEWSPFFNEFLDRYFACPGLPPLFVLYQGKRVAFLRFELVAHPIHFSRRCCQISINVAPEWRGKGIGQTALHAVKAWVADEGYDAIYAEIKEENLTSRKAFEKAGYKKLEDAKKQLPDSTEVVSICRYLTKLDSPWPRSENGKIFIIAEAGSNWRMGTYERDLKMAKTLIEVAADAGADAIKFQVFRPETVYVENAGQSDYLSDAGITADIRSIFADLAMPYEMIPELVDYCKKNDIMFMVTPFSKKDFEMIDPYVSIHKIASYEITHLRLLELAAHSGKPLILSTGAATEDDIEWAVKTFQAHGGKDLTLLQCTAHYPAEASSMNLKVIPWFIRRFHCRAGLSDHSRNPTYAPIAAVALGATVIEKHFTLSNSLPGPDHAFAITPHELKEMVRAIRRIEVMQGSGIKTIHESEKELLTFARRGVQAICEINAGDFLKEGENIDILRPGKQLLGVHPKYLAELEGKPAKRKIPLGSGIQKGDW